MPNHRTFWATSKTFAGHVEMTTAGQDSDVVLHIKTNRGTPVGLAPADLQSLLDFGRLELLAHQIENDVRDEVEPAPTCGFAWMAGHETLHCGLDLHHLQLTDNVDHVTRLGQAYLITPPF